MTTNGKWPRTVALLVLSLLVGVASAIVGISSYDFALLRPLPYASPTELLFLFGSKPEEGVPLSFVSYPNFLDWQSQLTRVSSVAAVSNPRPLLLGGIDEPVMVTGEYASGNYFSTLGISAVLGRALGPEDDQDAAAPAVVLSNRLFETHFGADRSTLGDQVRLNDKTFTVVGVLPPTYRGILGDPVDLWVPMSSSDELLGIQYLHDRALTWHLVVARLGPDTSREDLDSELALVAERLREQYPDANRGLGILPLALREVYFSEQSRAGLRYLLVAALCVFLLSLLNVVALLLTAFAAERRSFAIRGALGARNREIARYAARRLVLPCVAGGALALIVAYLVAPRLLTLSDLPPATIASFSIDARVAVLCFVLVAIAAASMIGATVLVFSRLALGNELRSGQRSSGAFGRSRWTMSILEVALAVTMLTGTSLMIRALFQLTHASPGYAVEDVASLQLDFLLDRYADPPARSALLARMSEEVARVRGVEGVAFIGPAAPPLLLRSATLLPEAYTDIEHDSRFIFRSAVSPGFFAALDVPLVAGRLLETADETSARPVAVIAQSLAAAAWGGDALGKRFRLTPQQAEDPAEPWWEVVGVVADIKGRGTGGGFAAPDFEVYLPIGLVPPKTVYVLVRTEGDLRATARAVADVVNELDPELARPRVETMLERFESRVANHRFASVILGLLSVIGLFLAAVGTYGVLHLWVVSRRVELAVRLALGARPHRLALGVIGQALRICGAGLAIGLLLSLAGYQVLRKMLYGVGAFDPWAMVAVGGALALVALFSAAFPAWRVLRTEPVESLRAGDP